MKIDKKTIYTKSNGRKFEGFYLDENLESNLRLFAVKAVKRKFDCIGLISGMEGSGKSTLGGTISKYVDPTFPGEPLNDGTPRRKCDRIVFTSKQINEAIDKAKPGQAILIDEAIITMGSQDAGSDIQKTLIKKFVTIRKKRLYIFIIIPSIFLLRKYFAIFRTRFLLHCTLLDGITRGNFNFFSYKTKRDLYIYGIKEFDQGCTRPSFPGRFTDTEGFFYDPVEYDKKKEAAIKEITSEKPKNKEPTSVIYKICKAKLSVMIAKIYDTYRQNNDVQNKKKFCAYMRRNFIIEITPTMLTKTINEASKIIEWCLVHNQSVEDYVRVKEGTLKLQDLKSKVKEGQDYR